MRTLPSSYQWLDATPDLPKLVTAMRGLYGTIEVPGHVDNQVILDWARVLGLDNVYSHDEIPWCGLAMAYACKLAGKPIPAEPLWALNWAKWGEPGGQPELGDVLIFVRPGGGHVGLYIGEDHSAYHVLGGNTHDAVAFARLDKHRLYAVRQPHYSAGKPLSSIPHFLSVDGELSTNEA